MTAAVRALALLLLVALALAPNLTSPMPDRDSGVFLYIGSQILEGRFPYRDIWDHKGPVIYALNAVGVWLDPGGEGGIWALEAAALAAAGALLHAALRRVSRRETAAAGVALFFGGLVLVLRPGNYTEEFALPLSLTSLFMFSGDGWRSGWKAPLLVGAALGAGLLLRPNLVATSALVGVVMVVARFRRDRMSGVVAGFGLMAGAVAVAAPVLAYLAAGNALTSAWDAYLTYNFAYVTAAPGSFAGPILEGLATLAPAGLSLLGLGTWLALAAGIGRRRLPRLAWLALAALPVELALVGLSGRGLTHYYITWLPALAILSAFGLEALVDLGAEPGRRRRFLRWAALALLAASLVWPVRRSLPNVVHVLRQGPRRPDLRVAFLNAHPDSPLLMWGAETAYHYFSGRPAVTRYVYQYPLYTCGYATPERVAEFRRQVEKSLPLLVDTSSTNRQVPPLDPMSRMAVPELTEACALAPEMVSVMDWLWATYQQVGRDPDTGWILYLPRAGPALPSG